MTSEVRNLVWLVIAAAIVMASLAGAAGIYLYRGASGPAGTIRVTSGADLFDPAGAEPGDPAPASGETRASGRVTIRPLDEDATDPDWRFSYRSQSGREPLSFETLFGAPVQETARSGSRYQDSGSRWRRETDYGRYAQPERWRPARNGDAERPSPGTREGWQRTEPTAQERIAQAGIDTSTPDGRLEQACLLDNHSRYACRCLVREVRRSLSDAELDFLTRTAQGEPPATRLRAAGLSLTTLPDLAVKLVELDAQTRRACRVGLTL